jgi:DNA-binding response OmpR family regulator
MQHFESAQCTVTVDEDPTVCRVIEKATGIRSLGFASSQEFLNASFKFLPLAVFLDIHPGTEGLALALIPTLQARWPFAPVIVVASEPTDECLYEACKQGANDFLLKPIHPREVQARFRLRLAELQERAARAELSAGDVHLDAAHRVVSGPLGRQFLAPVETLMLAQLIKANGTVVSKEAIKRDAWGPIHVSDNAFYRKLFELRRALENVTNNVKVHSIYGTGISLEISSNLSVPPSVVISAADSSEKASQGNRVAST